MNQKKKINEIIISDTLTYTKVGIFKAPKTRQLVERGADGYSEKEKERAFKQRKVVNRPSKELLLNEINEMTFVDVGKKYGVTDNTIRKWCKNYKIPYRKKDIKKQKFISHKKPVRVHSVSFIGYFSG